MLIRGVSSRVRRRRTIWRAVGRLFYGLCLVAMLLIGAYFPLGLPVTGGQVEAASSNLQAGSVYAAYYPPLGFDCNTVSQIPAAECWALAHLYAETGGPSWTDHTGWLANVTPCSWKGITCAAGHVTAINLFNNNLTGKLPMQIQYLKELTSLELSDNKLSGTIPPELGKLVKLSYFSVYGNQFSGAIPDALAGLVSLTSVGLGSNQFSGPIPAWLGNLHQLHYLYLGVNQFTGSIPASLGGLTNLEGLDLSVNQLTGPIPSELGGLSALTVLDLERNKLSGSIPASLGSLTHLGLLSLAENQLSGPIPPEIGSLSALKFLYLSNNQLTGSIPASLGNLTNLIELDLSRNKLSGAIPASLGNLTHLTLLDLMANALVGVIPPSLANLTVIETISLDYNALWAEAPALIAYLDGKRPGWQAVQTVAPAGVQAAALSARTVSLHWTPVAYQMDGGYYQIEVARAPTGPYTVMTKTTNKSANKLTLSGLSANTLYYVCVRAFTPAHDNQQNALLSACPAPTAVRTQYGYFIPGVGR